MMKVKFKQYHPDPIRFLFACRVAGGAKVFLILFFLLLFYQGYLVAEENTDDYGKINGPSQSWDFTGSSVPNGGSLRKNAELQNGLSATLFDLSVPAGYQLAKSAKELQTLKALDAFLFQAEIILNPVLKGKDVPRTGVLWDNLYITYIDDPNDKRCHQGFQVALEYCGDNSWQPKLYLGFGTQTERLTGPKAFLEPGKPVRLTFFFDANGSVFWDFAGEKSQDTVSTLGAIAPGQYQTVIGDRFGSNYNAFQGIIQRIKLTPYQRKPLAFRAFGRQAFLRGESNATVKLVLENTAKYPFHDIKLIGNWKDRINTKADNVNNSNSNQKDQRSQNQAGEVLPAIEKTWKELLPGKNLELNFPVETRLKPGLYPIIMTLTAQGKQGSICLKYNINIGIGPTYADRFPVVMWMFNNRPYPEVMDFGFTHGLTGFGYSQPEENVAATRVGMATLDKALTQGFRLIKSVGVYPPKGKSTNDYARLGRDGKILKYKDQPQLEVSNPEVQEYARATAEVNRKVFGSHPGWGGVLPNSEMRDGVLPSFRTEPAQYRAVTGQDIPKEVLQSTAPRSIAPKRFPEGRVPEDDPLLKYYTWFWNGGDGWPTINSVIANEYRKVNVKPFFSFFDPAVRTPPKWGSGGNVDVLSQWVYAVPEPLAVAGPAEELASMAAGHNQQVMIMTQIICYRNQIAPKTTKVDPVPNWALEKPDADFPTIPPDSLQEATWAMIAKPVKGIMYHGYACIVELGAKKGYTFTNTETPQRMKYLLNKVVAPLGPMLKRLPRPESPVAVLESFTSTIFNGHGTWGWIAPDLMFLQRARLDPRVLYEETILRDGFGNAKVLYASQCDYLPNSVIDKIIEFQKKGGIVIGDPLLTKAIKPDIQVPLNQVDRSQVAEGKKIMLDNVNELRKKLDPVYTPMADSSSPELITFLRQWEKTPYLFAINDKRTFGDYVGPWKMTMEKGLPFQGSITLSDPNRKIEAVYELSRGGQIPFTYTAQNKVQVDIKYTTNDGRLFLFLEKPIVSVNLSAPQTVKRGERLQLEFLVCDKSKQAISALLPVELRLFDSQGKELDGGGYACAENGKCTLVFQTNLNDPSGTYKAVGKDRASGLTQVKTITIE